MIIGHHQESTSYQDAGGNQVVALEAEAMPYRDAVVAKLSVLLDGGGEGSGVENVRGGIWTPEGELVAVTGEIEIPNGAPEGWYDLWFEEPVSWPQGVSRVLGVHFSNPDSIARWLADPAGTGLTWEDTYADGTGDVDPEDIGAEETPRLFATYAIPSKLPYEDDLYYARLGFWSAQAKLGESGATGEAYRAKAGWHGTFLDTESQGASFAIVDRESELADLVGDRIRVTHQRRSVVVFVHRVTEIDSGDVALSLSRRAFAALALLSTEEIDVRVEVLA